MKVNELLAQLGERRWEVLERAVQCQTAEELTKFADENGIELNEEVALELLGMLRPAVDELTDGELDVVTGGSEKQEEERKGSSHPVLW